ncbi:MAG: hypothetical protein R2761_09605 [Acidimicrobiales bacterium]
MRSLATALVVALALVPLVVACEEAGDTSAGGTVALLADGEEGSSTTSSGSGGSTADARVTHDPDDDSDQDDIPAAEDNCPDVFNPGQSAKDCDETKDEFDGPNPCGAANELAQLTDNGDEETHTVIYCLVEGDDPPPFGFGTVVLVDGPWVFVDVSDDELDNLRGQGEAIEEVDTVGTVTPERLIEARITLDPTHALETADTDHLPAVDPNVLLEVPDEAIADLPDDTLAALPTDYWTAARPSTIEVVGKDRLIRINPDPTVVRLPSKAIGDVKAGGIVTGDPTTTTATTTTSATTTSATTTSTARG